MRVFVYFNLHKKVWSVKALEGPNKGRVIQHATNMVLRDCRFKVSEAGRQRVILEKRKNVHAGVVGTLETSPDAWALGTLATVAVTYNPYKAGTFVIKGADVPVYSARYVKFDGRTVTATSDTIDATK